MHEQPVKNAKKTKNMSKFSALSIDDMKTEKTEICFVVI